MLSKSIKQVSTKLMGSSSYKIYPTQWNKINRNFGIKLEISNRKKLRKFINRWKLNNILLNSQWVKEGITAERENTLRSLKTKYIIPISGVTLSRDYIVYNT